MEVCNQTLPFSQLAEDKTVAMATTSDQQQQMAAYIELLNKSGRGEALSGELINYNQLPPQACVIL